MRTFETRLVTTLEDSLQLRVKLLKDVGLDHTNPDFLTRANFGRGVYKEALSDLSGAMSIYSLASFFEHSEHTQNCLTEKHGIHTAYDDLRKLVTKYALRADLYMESQRRGNGRGSELFKSTLYNFMCRNKGFAQNDAYFIGITNNPKVLHMAERVGGYALDPQQNTCFAFSNETAHAAIQKILGIDFLTHVQSSEIDYIVVGSKSSPDGYIYVTSEGKPIAYEIIEVPSAPATGNSVLLIDDWVPRESVLDLLPITNVLVCRYGHICQLLAPDAQITLTESDFFTGEYRPVVIPAEKAKAQCAK